MASGAAGTVEGYQRDFNRWKSFASQTLRVPCFPVSPTNFALFIQYLLERTGSALTINTAFYAINWAHKLAGLESPTDHPTVLLIKEGTVRTCSQKCNRKEPLEPDHLKGLARRTNFEDLLQLRSLVMYVLSFCGFLRSAEILELRRNSISFKSDHMEIIIVKSKTDQLREGEILVIAKTEGDLCPVNLLQLYLSKAGIPDNSTNMSSGQFPLLRSKRSLFPQIGISPIQHTGNPSKRPSRGLFPIFLNTVPIPLDREERLLQPILELKKGFSKVIEDGKRRRLRICIKDSVSSRFNVSKSLGR